MFKPTKARPPVTKPDGGQGVIGPRPIDPVAPQAERAVSLFKRSQPPMLQGNQRAVGRPPSEAQVRAMPGLPVPSIPSVSIPGLPPTPQRAEQGIPPLSVPGRPGGMAEAAVGQFPDNTPSRQVKPNQADYARRFHQ